ncbi:hypothetical protein CsSME_00049945 [Camellia sinensis var. sinensis]
MKFTIDLWYIVPPWVNIFVHLLQLSQGNPYRYSSSSSSSFSDHPLMSMMASHSLVSLVFFFFFFLLFISVRAPLTLSLVCSQPIQLRFGHFYISGFLVVTLMIVSLVFPPSLFWYSYLFTCICIYISKSPWFHPLFHVLMGYVQTIPTLFIICTTTITTQQQPETATTTATTTLETQLPHQSEFELNEIDDVYLFLNEDPSLEHERFEIIYGHA